ncbi:glycosyltransferase family 4 protein [Microcoleus sp. FACHB-SPT15]|uniref:glycosyltransferase family 4 protein n=1 Tax=Microcoleus sp. FACHB-SPT15 TaxID=2692830 RepID=UPI001780F4D8|nr:glycosyltransferase family 4 protein [Microcoleus sp. FACHB-SPT15]MBD1805028.1 glycosyltransferase family 4 protein [Microcoleus sp. FACHB-SPT15]
MNKPLAIVAPRIGARSETFIQRHMQDLLPGNTVIVAAVNSSDADDWNVDCPILVRNWLHKGGYRERMVRAATQMVQSVTQNLGWRPAERPWEFIKEAAKEFLQKYQVQVIMGEYLDLCFPWLQVAQELGIQFFGHAHGYDVSYSLQDAKWRKKYLRYNETGGIITMSQASRERLLSLGLQPNKVHVVPYGIEVSDNPLKRTEQEIVHCLAVGRMVAKKAPLKTLEAFRQASETCPKLRLDYVGAGELLPSAQEFVRIFNLGEKVTLHGGQSNAVVQQLMKKADIFLQHSMTDPESGNEEGLPVAILEAMAQSLPVVSTHHAGIPEAVLDTFTGYLVDEGDSVGMAECLVALTRDPDLRVRLGEAGWRRAKEHFSWEKEQGELLRILGLSSSLKNK